MKLYHLRQVTSDVQKLREKIVTINMKTANEY